MTPAEISALADIRARHKAFQRGEFNNHAEVEWWAIDDRGSLLALLDAVLRENERLRKETR